MENKGFRHVLNSKSPVRSQTKWMENARNQAKQMAKNTIDEFRGASLEATTSIGNYFLKIMIPMFIGFLLLKACQS